MSFSTMPSTHGFVFAVAMAAVSGAAVILLALQLHKSFPAPPLPPPKTEFQPEISSSPPRPCISSGEKKRNKKKKRVRFAKDVIEPSANNEEFRRKTASSATNTTVGVTAARSGMPANRVALYNGILRDRVVHRLGYSFLVN